MSKDKIVTGEKKVKTPINKLNDLDGKGWLVSTKSYWFSKKCKEDKFAYQHPAPFLIKDIERLILFFTKKGQLVLDPFMGTGTTLVSCDKTNRVGIGIDLNKDFCTMAKKRLDELHIKGQRIIHGDALDEVVSIKKNFDYCVTSPPYHNILSNNGGGLRNKNGKYRNGARIGVENYSTDARDLGNQEKYEDFISLYQKIMEGVYQKIKVGGYVSIIISDFTVEKKEKNVQGDIVKSMEDIGFRFVGTVILLQENKPLYPFGYPYAFVINHHHQNIIHFRKVEKSE